MMNDILLSMPVSRAWARRGVGLIGGDTSVLGPRLVGQWSLVEGLRTQEGFSFDYPADTEFVFPTGAGAYGARRYADSRAFGEGRLIVNVLEAGVSGSALSVDIDGGSFVGSAPSCPLDSVGFFESEWEDIVLPSTPDPLDSVEVSWLVSNPTASAGTGAIGTCQFQVR